MTGATLANSPLLFILVGVGLLAIIAFALYSFKKAKKRCLELGMSEETISAVVKSTISAAIIPSLAILLGFVILSVSLGVAWPWWRLSVIGSLAYETMAAQYTADGLGVALSEILSSDPTVFASVMIVMTIGIIAGPLMIAVVGEKFIIGLTTSKYMTFDTSRDSYGMNLYISVCDIEECADKAARNLASGAKGFREYWMKIKGEYPADYIKLIESKAAALSRKK